MTTLKMSKRHLPFLLAWVGNSPILFLCQWVNYTPYVDGLHVLAYWSALVGLLNNCRWVTSLGSNLSLGHILPRKTL